MSISINLLTLFVLATQPFAPKTFTVDPKVSYWGQETKDAVYTPGGQPIAAEYNGPGAPIRIDTTVQLTGGVDTLRFNARDRRYKIVSPSGGQTPTVQITAKGSDTVVTTYSWDLLSPKNEELIITSSDDADTGKVSITVFVR